MEGIRIESLLHLAAWNRENERAEKPRTPTKAAPLKEVLNNDRPQLVPLNEIAPQSPGLSTAKKPIQASLEYITDPQNALVLAPLGGSNTSNSGSGSLPAITTSRLPTLSTITNPPSKPTKSTAPLAEVLNDEDSRSPNLAPLHQPSSSRRSSVSSGHTRKRRKLSNAPTASLSTTSVSTAAGLTLPKPQPRVRREGRRNRIPPVISGLHDPPEDAVLLPSIAASAVDGNWMGALPSNTSRQLHDERHEPAVQITAVAEEEASRDNEAQHQQPAGLPTTDNTAAKTNEPGGPPDPSTEQNGKKSKKKSKDSKGGYRRWTDQEGVDLVAGVKKFGIGAWKQIREHPDYHFNNRSTVDLKDRFRRCFPKEYKKAGEAAAQKRTAKATGASAEMETTQKEVRNDVSSETRRAAEDDEEEVAAPKSNTKVTSDSLPVAQSDPTPAKPDFVGGTRRGRIKFTEEEDDAILRGFQKYGPKWNKIRSDPELNLQHRSRTDLRDRFRNKCPDEYTIEGAKKPLAERDGNEESTTDKSDGKGKAMESDTSPTAQPQLRNEPSSSHPALPSSSTVTDSITFPIASHTAASRPIPILQALPTVSHFPFTVPDIEFFPDLDADDDVYSEPVTLRRDIFDYIPPHPSKQPAPATTQTNVVLDNAIAHSLDQLHNATDMLTLRPLPLSSSSAAQPSTAALSRMPLASMLSDNQEASGGNVSLPGFDYLTTSLEDDTTRDMLW